MPTYVLTVQPYLDQYNKCYKKIVTINIQPTGPLSQHVKRINPPKLSPFKQPSPCCPVSQCILAITDINDPSQLMCANEIPNLFSFLSMNGYTIDTNLTKMMNESEVKLDNKLLCFITI